MEAATEGLGARIRRLREKRGLTMAALGRAVGADGAGRTVASWETGERRPGTRWLMPLARELGVRPGYLLSGEGPEGVIRGGS